MKYIDYILNFGTNDSDDINQIRLYRQVNGLNLFYTFVAFSVGFISLFFLSDNRGTAVLGIVQIAAAFLYFGNYLLSSRRKLLLARYLTLYVFEWHLFIVVLLTNAWHSPALPVIILFPTLAALVEMSIVRHTAVGLFQGGILLVLHLFFNNYEEMLLAFTQLNNFANLILSIIGVAYFPVMTGVIIRIIYRENMRARERQKEMLGEISFKNRQLEIYADRLKDESQRLLAEVNIAKEIQMMVLPSRDELDGMSNYDISCYMQTAAEVGGDYYDIFNINKITTIAIGDVTGHGLSSGLIMLMAQTAVRTLGEVGILDPVEFISILNRVLYANINRIKENKNMTFLLVTQKDDRYIVSGQHESILICRNGRACEEIDTVNLGFYLGMIPDITDQLQSYEFTLNVPDVMLLYSDGITEAFNETGEQFGIERLKDVFMCNQHQSAEKIKFKIMKEIYNFIGNTEIFDDMSLVIIRMK